MRSDKEWEHPQPLNSDIFDHEELLAIANDGGDGSSSSSCHSSAGSDEEENDSSRLHSPFVSAAKGGEINFLSSERGEEAATVLKANQLGVGTGSCALAKNIKTNDSPPSNQQSEPSSAPEPKGQGDDNRASSRDDNSNDDDVFLESWFESENRAPVAVARGAFDSEDARHEDGNARTNIEEGVGVVGIEKDTNHGDKIKLGASVLQWISATKSKSGEDVVCSACNYPGNGGVVALQRNIDEHDDAAISRTSTLIFPTTRARNPRKRSRAGYELSTDATLEQVTLSGCGPDRMVKKNRVRLTHTRNEEGLSTTPGAMVDCLARYDSPRECYVLEIVDLMVDKIEPLPEAVLHNEQMLCAIAGTNRNNSPNPSTDRFDPRSVTKRAEDQLRKLKQGKGRTGAPKKIRETKVVK